MCPTSASKRVTSVQNQSQTSFSETTQGHPVPDGHYNEAFDLNKPRRHWQYLLDSIETLGNGELHDRHKKASRILRDDGATYTCLLYTSDAADE